MQQQDDNLLTRDVDDMSKDELLAYRRELEDGMNAVDFWEDKERAQRVIAKYNDVKGAIAGVGKYDNGPAILSILAGAGGQDAEDFARMLLEMYVGYAKSHGWDFVPLHQNRNDHGGYRNITLEIKGKGAYGNLKYESGVHRLVRISPFNAQKKRHTSFALVEVVPKLPPVGEIEIPDADLDVEFSKSGGPGGQNVNKRETAVRVVHKSTGISVHVDSERTQKRNREKALEILRGKLYHKKQVERQERKERFGVAPGTDIEWGNQIRSYVLHPYQLVKDHRSDTEVRDVDAVLGGDVQVFIDAQKEEGESQ